ncbi:hypothetical protein HHI36_012981, partial [Cryptolaemus montrouzieri]
MNKGISGFRTAGIWPFEPNTFSEDDFGPNEPSDSTATEIPINLNETEVNIETPVDLIPGSSETNQIFTSTPLKPVLEKRQEERNLSKEAKEIKKKKNGKKKVERVEKPIVPKKASLTKKPGVRKLQLDDSESESCDKSQLCDDDELYDIDADPSHDLIIYIVWGQFGRDKEIWYRCVICSFWSHAECN